jgi:hypothetical protein
MAANGHRVSPCRIGQMGLDIGRPSWKLINPGGTPQHLAVAVFIGGMGWGEQSANAARGCNAPMLQALARPTPQRLRAGRHGAARVGLGT